VVVVVVGVVVGWIGVGVVVGVVAIVGAVVEVGVVVVVGAAVGVGVVVGAAVGVGVVVGAAVGVGVVVGATGVEVVVGAGAGVVDCAGGGDAAVVLVVVEASPPPLLFTAVIANVACGLPRFKKVISVTVQQSMSTRLPSQHHWLFALAHCSKAWSPPPELLSVRFSLVNVFRAIVHEARSGSTYWLNRNWGILPKSDQRNYIVHICWHQDCNKAHCPYTANSVGSTYWKCHIFQPARLSPSCHLDSSKYRPAPWWR
jgi:hypothetical protein